MARQQYGRQQRSRTGPFLVAFMIVLTTIIGGALLLHATGTIEIPFLTAKKPPPPPPDRTGMVQVPITSKAVPAYSMVTREHLLQPSKDGRLSYAMYWMKESEVPAEAKRDVGQILGRVIRSEKPAGFYFVEQEFFPQGTRPGPTAGIPPGKRAMRLKADEVPGLHGLNQGDRFDIVMAMVVEIEEAKDVRSQPDLDVEGPWSGLHEAGQRPPPAPPRVVRRKAEVRTVVEDGAVVQPIHNRKEITSKSSLFKGNSLRARPVEELIIAVTPEEVAALKHAMAIGARLSVAMRSGRVTDGEDQGRIPDKIVEIEELLPPEGADEGTKPSPTRLVEVIDGGRKRLKAVPVNPGDDEDGK